MEGASLWKEVKRAPFPTSTSSPRPSSGYVVGSADSKEHRSSAISAMILCPLWPQACEGSAVASARHANPSVAVPMPLSEPFEESGFIDS